MPDREEIQCNIMGGKKWYTNGRLLTFHQTTPLFLYWQIPDTWYYYPSMVVLDAKLYICNDI